MEQLSSELTACRDEVDNNGRAAIDELLGYYASNAARMRYADFTAAGYLIGSGIVESADRHVIQTRMKRAGRAGAGGGANGAHARACGPQGPSALHGHSVGTQAVPARAIAAQAPEAAASNR